jgi:hypothetical protein
MSILDLFRRRKVPACSVCGRTSEQVIKDGEAKSKRTGIKFVSYGHLVGICPTCAKAFCIDHAPYDYSFAVDSTVCPKHKVALDFRWDQAPDQ